MGNGTRKVTVTLPRAMVARIDGLRGLASRSMYVRVLLEEVFRAVDAKEVKA